MGKSQDLYLDAKKLMPGGTQLLSKRPEMFLPGDWPAYYSRAKGCDVWDLDGNQYKDFSYMGIGANVLGYADDDVNSAVIKAVNQGNMCTLNAPEEVELAGELCEIHPWASMVKYTRSGGEAAAVAIRIARAHTKKDIVLFCGYHGWHDWYLASNLGDESNLEGHLLPGLDPAGVPKALKGTSFPFAYNDLVALKNLMSQYAGQVAAIMMEPIRNIQPKGEFLEKVSEIAKANNVLLIYDEISAGFRLCLGGSHLQLGTTVPDIAIFGKALSNGYPMAAIIGTQNVMQSAQDSFISSTYWTERIGPVAALATLRKYKELQVEKTLELNGRRIQAAWKELAEMNNINISIKGIAPLSYFEFSYANSLELKTLFIQEMLKAGYLSTTGYYASYAHTADDITNYLLNVEKVFKKISSAINDNKVSELLEGEICHAGFKRLS